MTSAMEVPNTSPVITRAQREKEALRQMWEVIAWVSAFLAAAVYFCWYPGWGPEAGTIVLLALIGLTAFACWNLRESLGESVTTSIGMRLGLFSLVFAVFLVLLPLLVVAFFILNGIVISVTNWYVKTFP